MARGRSAPTSEFLIAGALQGLTQGILQGMQQRQVNEHNDAILKLSMDKLELDRQQLEENRAKGIQDTLNKAVDDRNNNKVTETTLDNIAIYQRIIKSDPKSKQGQLSMLTDVGAMKGINKQPNQSDTDFASAVLGAIGIKIDAERLQRGNLPIEVKDALEIQNKIAPEILSTQFQKQNAFDQNLIRRIQPILDAKGEKLEDHFIQFNVNDLKNFVGAQPSGGPEPLGQKLPVFLIPKNAAPKETKKSEISSDESFVEPPVAKVGKKVFSAVGNFLGIEPANEKGEARFLGLKMKKTGPTFNEMKKEKESKSGDSGGLFSGLSIRGIGKENRAETPVSKPVSNKLKFTPIK